MNERARGVPDGYHSVNPYIVVGDVDSLIDFLGQVFGAIERGDREISADGTIGHAEVQIGDSVVMLSQATTHIRLVLACSLFTRQTSTPPSATPSPPARNPFSSPASSRGVIVSEGSTTRSTIAGGLPPGVLASPEATCPRERLGRQRPGSALFGGGRLRPIGLSLGTTRTRVLLTELRPQHSGQKTLSSPRPSEPARHSSSAFRPRAARARTQRTVASYPRLA